jgi:proteasome lid subunit RPN8/RPN11
LQKIKISNSHKKILTEHAENEKPNESCAILFGKEDTVSDIFLTKNIEESPVNFTISNEQLIEGYKIAEDKQLDVIGIFHSHPNKQLDVIGIFHSHPNSEAYPSNTDKKFMHSNPVVWIIYSGANKDFKAFFLESGILEIPIEE